MKNCTPVRNLSLLVVEQIKSKKYSLGVQTFASRNFRDVEKSRNFKNFPELKLSRIRQIGKKKIQNKFSINTTVLFLSNGYRKKPMLQSKLQFQVSSSRLKAFLPSYGAIHSSSFSSSLS